jgi:hypothetical protein
LIIVTTTTTITTAAAAAATTILSSTPCSCHAGPDTALALALAPNVKRIGLNDAHLGLLFALLENCSRSYHQLHYCHRT